MELEQLGWNALTIGFLGTMIFTLIEGWGLREQGKTIWRTQSGQSVSIITFCYFAALFSILFIYGLSVKSIAMTFNGIVLSVLHIPILRGLWKFKGFTKTEQLLSIAFLATVCTTLFVSFKDVIFLVISFGNIAALSMQPYEIWKEKSSGAVEIKLLAVYLTSTSFWIIYAYSIHDWVLQIICPAFLVIFSITTILWFKYRSPNERADN